MPLPEHLHFLAQQPEESARNYHDRLREGSLAERQKLDQEREQRIQSLKNELSVAQAELKQLNFDHADLFAYSQEEILRLREEYQQIIQVAKAKKAELVDKIKQLNEAIAESSQTFSQNIVFDEAARLAHRMVMPRDIRSETFQKRVQVLWDKAKNEFLDNRIETECQTRGKEEAQELCDFLKSGSKLTKTAFKQYSPIQISFQPNGEQYEYPNCLFSNNKRFINAFVQGYRESLLGAGVTIPLKIGNQVFEVNLELVDGDGVIINEYKVWPKPAQEDVVINSGLTELQQLDLTPGEARVFKKAITSRLTFEQFKQELANSDVVPQVVEELMAEAEQENRQYETESKMTHEQKLKELQNQISDTSKEHTHLSQEYSRIKVYISKCKSYNEWVLLYRPNQESIESHEKLLVKLNGELNSETGKTRKIWFGFREVNNSDPNKISHLKEEIQKAKNQIQTYKVESLRLEKLIAEAGQEVNDVYNDRNRHVPLKSPYSEVDIANLNIERDELEAKRDSQYVKLERLSAVNIAWNQKRGTNLNLEEAELLFGDLFPVMDVLRGKLSETVREVNRQNSKTPLIYCIITLEKGSIKLQIHEASSNDDQNTSLGRIYPEMALFSGHDRSNPKKTVDSLPFLKQVAKSPKLQVAMGMDLANTYKNIEFKNKPQVAVTVIDKTDS